MENVSVDETAERVCFDHIENGALKVPEEASLKNRELSAIE